MKKPSKRSSHCNKRSFPDQETAVRNLHSTLYHADKVKGEKIITQIQAYPCEYCGKWHIGRNKRLGINWSAVEKDAEDRAKRIAEYLQNDPAKNAG